MIAAPPAREPTGALYAAVRAVGRFWIWFFFKAVDVRHADRVPATRPRAPLHQPPEQPHRLAPGGRRARREGALPRHRRALPESRSSPASCSPAAPSPSTGSRTPRLTGDGVGVVGAERNVDAFTACFRTLAAGGLIGIYPEGTTHAEPRVQRIKTGAARIALEYEARRARRRRRRRRRARWRLVPVGLTFEARKSFRGRVLVAFGEPVPLAPYCGGVRRRSRSRRWTRSPPRSRWRWRRRSSTCAGWTGTR